eukprot:tig00000113_g5696.t1
MTLAIAQSDAYVDDRKIQAAWEQACKDERVCRAEACLKSGLAEFERRCGKEHPVLEGVLTTLYDLHAATATPLTAAGDRLDAAAVYLRRLLSIQEEKYGLVHKATEASLERFHRLLVINYDISDAAFYYPRLLAFIRQTGRAPTGVDIHTGGKPLATFANKKLRALVERVIMFVMLMPNAITEDIVDELAHAHFEMAAGGKLKDPAGRGQRFTEPEAQPMGHLRRRPAAVGQGRGQERTAPRGASAGAPPCRFFAQGVCRAGDQCRLASDVPSLEQLVLLSPLAPAAGAGAAPPLAALPRLRRLAFEGAAAAALDPAARAALRAALPRVQISADT